MNNLYP